MEVLYIIVPLAIAFAGFAVLSFIWLIRHSQLEDAEGSAHRILIDDEE